MFCDCFTTICMSTLLYPDCDKKLMSKIGILIESYKDKQINNYTVKGKEISLFGLLEWLLNYRRLHPFFDFNLLISELELTTFAEYKNLIIDLKKELTNEKYQSYADLISNRVILLDIFKEKDKIKDLFDNLENFDTYSIEVVEKWRSLLSQSYEKILEYERDKQVDNVSELSICDPDSFRGVFRELEAQIGNKEVIPTGFNFLDNSILQLGGFEPKRLYLVAGSSGIGKSMFLINLLINASKYYVRKETQSTFVYITAENLLDETFLRFYCCTFNIPYREILNRIFQARKNNSIDSLFSDIINDITEFYINHNFNVVFKYFTPHKSTVLDLESLLLSLSEKENIKAVYIDYLDLFSSGFKYVEYRRELSSVTQFFKNLAVYFDIPIITATQLNREGYNSTPSLTQISESIEKVNKADFVLFLQNSDKPYVLYDNVEYKSIKCTVLKNRSGSVSAPQDIYVPYKNSLTNRFVFDFSIVELQDVQVITDSTNVTYNFVE